MKVPLTLRAYNRLQMRYIYENKTHRYYTAQRFGVAEPTKEMLLTHWLERGGAVDFSKTHKIVRERKHEK